VLAKPPAFQFYPKDWLSDDRVQSMTPAQRGAYIDLLCHNWLNGSLPIDPHDLAHLARVDYFNFTRMWKKSLRECFVQATRAGRLTNPRLEREREKQRFYAELRAAAGKRGGRPQSKPKANGKQTESKPQSKTEAKKRPPSSSSSADRILIVPPEMVPKEGVVQTDPRSPHNALAGDGRFARFWASYPNKKGKDDAKKAWDKRHPSETLTDLIVAAVEQQKTWPEWTKEGGRFIPHPATWLNRGSWEDEPSRQTTAVSDTTQANLRARASLLARVGRES
jgi:uncharacterized protein YdaU (DUF1376 family)